MWDMGEAMATQAQTFIFMDLVGYTALSAEQGDDGAADVAFRFYDHVRELLAEHRAEEIKTIGDAMMIRGDDPQLAICLGLRVVDDLDARGLPPVRVGVHTRTCLMASAAKVFTSRGLQQASIDEVAEDAGYTKGAFYANFKNKEELFLAMLDERFTERIEQIESVIAGEGTAAERARRAGDEFTHMIVADPEWQRLFF